MISSHLKIEDSFFLPEVREGFVVSAEMKKIWAVELDLLNIFARVCNEHHLKWFAHAGTMLGAVRHQGFIPWDDDIDVVMPRDDFERLNELGPSVFIHPYFYQNENTDPFFAKNFARLRNSMTTAIVADRVYYQYPFNQGIYIDILPIDNIPDNLEERRSYYDNLTILNAKSSQWRDMIHFYHPYRTRGWRKRVKYYVKHLYFKYLAGKKGDYKYYMQQHHDLVMKYDDTDTEYVGETIIPPLGRWEWKKEWVDNVVYMPFEMLSIPVPVGFAECLEAGFGKDWRIPKQVGALHGSILFDVDKTYTEYL